MDNALERIYRAYHSPRFLGTDPLSIVRKYRSRKDQEIFGLTAACLSYGRVESILSSLGRIQDAMDGAPHAFAVSTTYRRKKHAFKSFRHRFTTGRDVALLLESVKRVCAAHGSLENAFAGFCRPGDVSVKNALNEFVAMLRKHAGAIERTVPRSFRYLVCSPESGCACKRMNMFLRWMVRGEDGIDLGTWNRVPPSLLVVPLDTHVARVAHALGLTRRRTAGWKMAEEITAALKKNDPEDPAKYDFSLCRYGMMQFRGKKNDGR